MEERKDDDEPAAAAADHRALIEEAFRNPATMGSISRVYHALREAHPEAGIKEREVKDFFETQEFPQRIRRPTKAQAVYMPVIAPLGSYQMDILKVGRRSILTAVEMTTRWGFAVLIPNQEHASLLPALRKILEEARAAGLPVLQFEGDQQFNKRDIKDVLERENGMHVWFTDPYDKTSRSKIEAFNGVLRQMIVRYQHLVDANWAPHLDEFLANYNRRRHTRTGMAPIDVTARKALSIRAKEIIRAGPALRYLNSFRPGMKVRTRAAKQQFGKWGPLWDKRVRTVRKLDGFSVLLDGDDRKRWRPRDLLKVSPGTLEETGRRDPAPEINHRHERDMRLLRIGGGDRRGGFTRRLPRKGK